MRVYVNRYEHGKIYKLVNDIDDEIYVGNTTMPLNKRFYMHKIASYDQNSPIYKHMRNIGIEHFKIVLIEEYPAKNKSDLESRERHWIDELDASLNHNLPRKIDIEINKINIEEINEGYNESILDGDILEDINMLKKENERLVKLVDDIKREINKKEEIKHKRVEKNKEDKMQNFMDKFFEITEDPDDFIDKKTFLKYWNDYYKTKKQLNDLIFEIKRFATYDKDKKYRGVRGVIRGVKYIEKNTPMNFIK